MGILELAGRDMPDRAAEYFELAAQAATSWTEASGTLDLDTWNIRELSLGHLCIAFARCEPRAAAHALDRLAEILDDRVPADAERIAWWKTRTFNELVAHGNPADRTGAPRRSPTLCRLPRPFLGRRVSSGCARRALPARDQGAQHRLAVGGTRVVRLLRRCM